MLEKESIRHHLELMEPRPIKLLNRYLRQLVSRRLWLKVLLGMIFGIITGLILGPSAGIFDPEFAMIVGEWLALPGIVFLGIIQMVVIPLIFASIIIGISTTESLEQLRKTGMRIAVYFIFTTTIAILIGVFLAVTIQPGQYISLEAIESSIGSNVSTDSTDFATPSIAKLPILVATVIPTNIFGSMLNGEMLQVVLFAIIFGIALVNIYPKQSKPLLDLLSSLQQVCMMIVKWAMLLAPIAVFGLMAKLTSHFGLEVLLGTTVYVATVLLGLLIMLVVYLCIVFFSSGITPRTFLQKIKDVQLLAFSTSSSAAVMPLSIKTTEEKLGVRSSIAQFVIPIGTTINMDGTALYQAIATIFLAQVFGVDLTLAILVWLIVTIVGASIGSPATPGIGIVILSVALSGLGIPLAGIALILGVDRILDMCRTAINVTGDLTASILMNRLAGGNQAIAEEARQPTTNY